jgi:uncharacterized RDD family membrane protein YckC
MSHIAINTTQNVELEYPAATLGDRVFASLIDRFILIVYVLVMFLIISENIYGSTNRTVFNIIAMLPAIFYSLLFEIFVNGQSIGKIALRIRVIRMDGKEPTVGNYLIRWMLRIIDVWLMGGVIGFICIAASTNAQRLGDMAAGTVVIRLKRRTNLSDTLAEHTIERPRYVPRIPEAELLSDRQAALIQEVLNAYARDDNYQVVDSLDKKLRAMLNIQSDMPPLDFLRTLLADYVELHKQGRVV